jgi:hypothetical protein
MLQLERAYQLCKEIPLIHPPKLSSESAPSARIASELAVVHLEDKNQQSHRRITIDVAVDSSAVYLIDSLKASMV